MKASRSHCNKLNHNKNEVFYIKKRLHFFWFKEIHFPEPQPKKKPKQEESTRKIEVLCCFSNAVLETEIHYNKAWAIIKTKLSLRLQINSFRDRLVTHRMEIHFHLFNFNPTSLERNWTLLHAVSPNARSLHLVWAVIEKATKQWESTFPSTGISSTRSPHCQCLLPDTCFLINWFHYRASDCEAKLICSLITL